MRAKSFFIPSLIFLISAGFYFIMGTYQATPPKTETAYYFIKLSIDQAEFYLLAAILFALWGILDEIRRQ